jgi:hypothetical protein
MTIRDHDSRISGALELANAKSLLYRMVEFLLWLSVAKAAAVAPCWFALQKACGWRIITKNTAELAGNDRRRHLS